MGRLIVRGAGITPALLLPAPGQIVVAAWGDEVRMALWTGSGNVWIVEGDTGLEGRRSHPDGYHWLADRIGGMQ